MSSRPTSTQAGVEEPETLVLDYRYTTLDGERRKVLVAVDAIEDTGVWSVYDMPRARGAEVGWLVERLDGYDEKLDAAIGLARAYCESQVAFHEPGREFCPPDPLPNPTEVPVAEIRKHAALARRLAAALSEPRALAA